MAKTQPEPKSIRFGPRHELIEADAQRLGINFHQWVLRACDAMLPREHTHGWTVVPDRQPPPPPAGDARRNSIAVPHGKPYARESVTPNFKKGKGET